MNYTDNDGNPIGLRFYTDPEYPKRIFDAATDSYDKSLELWIVGWWPEGDASRYADEIAAMLNLADSVCASAQKEATK